MKFETQKDEHKFLNIIQELREETGHHLNHIFTRQLNRCIHIYEKARSKAEAKDWIKVELGW